MQPQLACCSLLCCMCEMYGEMNVQMLLQVQVLCAPAMQVKVDGESVEEEDLRFEILPAHIRVAVPSASK